jgi:hypothetical protein
LDVERNKNGRYEYLVDSNSNIPCVDAVLLDSFKSGTSVVHFEMQIDRYAARMTQLTKSLWWLLQNSLFDPVLPVWAEEARKKELKGKNKPDRRSIVGNHTRLSSDVKDKVEHSDSVDISVPHDCGQTQIKVHYWVLRETEGSSSTPISSYVDSHRPVAFTFYGQTHGTADSRFINERLRLPYLNKFLIIQIELEYLHGHARRDTLSSTRDRLKDTEFYRSMRDSICTTLAEDENLIRLNEERKEQLLSRYTERDKEKLRERFAQLMERFKVGSDADVGGKGTKENSAPKSGGTSSREPLKPLPTKDVPTFIKIANAQKPVPIRIDRHALLRIESNALDGYLKNHIHSRIFIVPEPKGLIHLDSRSDFRGGRARLTIRVSEDAKPGSTGTVTVVLLTHKETDLQDSINFKVELPPEPKSTGPKGKTGIKVPEPIPIYKEKWARLNWDEKSVAQVNEEQDETQIFVNMDNHHISKLTHSNHYGERGVKRMENGFLLYCAFYSWLQHVQQESLAIEISGEDYEKYKAAELDRVAQTVVHSISSDAKVADNE